MRLVRYTEGGRPALGLVDGAGETVIGVAGVLERELGGGLVELLDTWSDQDRSALEAAARGSSGRALRDTPLLAPCAPLRRNVFCVGKNYRDHAEEFERSGYDSSAAPGAAAAQPVIFTKATTAVIG
ncbi:protein containing Fumarylacetoacetase, partial [mine drainage metagenome]